MFLVCTCTTLGLPVDAQSVAEPPQSTAELNLAAYIEQLDRCAESVRQGQNVAAMREALPRTWVVRADNSRMEISNERLITDLRRAEQSPGKAREIYHQVQARLAVMRSAAQELQKGSGEGSQASAQPALERILQRREFSGAKGPSNSELWGARVSRWITEHMLRFLSRLHIGATAGNTVTWGVVGLAFAALCYWVWDSLPRGRGDAPAIEVAKGSNDPRKWAAEAVAAAERGDYREAIHCAYWAAIVHLETLGVLKRDRARTPRESLRLLEPHPKERQLLGDFTRHFELIWYGYRPASLDDWARARAHLEKMGCLTPLTPATVNS
jgi:hypothetical protein